MPAAVAAVAVYAASGTAAFGAIATSFGIVGTALAGAVVGAVAGGATAAIMGEDIGDGALVGALGGAASGGIVGTTKGASLISGEGYVHSAGQAAAGKDAVAAARGSLLKPSKWGEIVKPVVGQTNTVVQSGGGIVNSAGREIVGGVGGEQLAGGAAGATSGAVDPALAQILTANQKAAADATKWQMIGNAATEGAKGLLAEDPDDELERQLELKQADKIRLSEGFASRAPKPSNAKEIISPFARRLAERRERLYGRAT